MFKKIKYTIAVFSLVFASAALTSCESDVIDLSPVVTMPEPTAYSTAAKCELAVIGSYDIAHQGLYNDSYARGFPFGGASIIQGEMRGEDMNLSAVFYDITYSATYTTSSANNRFYWEASFEGINRHNVVMAGIAEAVANGVLTQEQGNIYKGELLFLRALTYHSLMTHFALPYNVSGNNNYGLPLYLTAIKTSEDIEAALQIGRSTVADTYTQIIKDLDEAESLFPNNGKNSKDGISRAYKGAVVALKTRVYLHMRDWPNVKIEAAKMVNGTTAPFTSPIGSYELESNPGTPFSSYTSNKESVFSIAQNSIDNATVNGTTASMMNASNSSGRAIVSSSPTLYNSTYWLATDKRRDLLYYKSSDQYYFCDKYKLPATREEWVPIIRYSEVLLNYAEAALRSNDKTLALELLNTVRNRSLEDPSTEAYTLSDFADDVEFMTAILWERRIEFHGEGRRWEDIHRLAADDLVPSGGIPAKLEYNNVKNKGAFVIGKAIDPTWYTTRAFIPYTDHRFIWPIPVNDIVRNPTLANQQNAGW